MLSFPNVDALSENKVQKCFSAQTSVSAYDIHAAGFISECPDVVTYLPTIMSSHSEARDLKLFHRSMVKMVLALLKMEVSEDMRAAIITAIIKPRSPGRKDTTVTIKDSSRKARGRKRDAAERVSHLQEEAP